MKALTYIFGFLFLLSPLQGRKSITLRPTFDFKETPLLQIYNEFATEQDAFILPGTKTISKDFPDFKKSMSEGQLIIYVDKKKSLKRIPSVETYPYDAIYFDSNVPSVNTVEIDLQKVTKQAIKLKLPLHIQLSSSQLNSTQEMRDDAFNNAFRIHVNDRVDSRRSPSKFIKYIEKAIDLKQRLDSETEISVSLDLNYESEEQIDASLQVIQELGDRVDHYTLQIYPTQLSFIGLMEIIEQLKSQAASLDKD